MPPTLAAARNTTCGVLLINQSNTAAWSRRSSSRRPTVTGSTFSCASRRTSAEPTMPRWPATRTVLPFNSNGVLAIGDLLPGDLKIASHHFLDQLGEAGFRFPPEFLPSLAGIADQDVDLGRAKIARIDAHDGLAGLFVDARLFDPLAPPLDVAADLGESELDKLAYRARLSRCEHEIVRLIGLQDRVHALDIVPRMAPVALGLEIAEIDRVFQANLDAGHTAGDLARHEGFAADRAFMIEQNTVGGEHAVGLAIVHRDPVAVQLGHAIGRTRVEWRGLRLRNLLRQPVEFRSGSLIE